MTIKTGFILGTIMLALAGCDSTESDWQRAKKTNTINGYQTFLATHSQGIHTDEARRTIENLAWKDAQAANSIEGYKTYLNAHAEGSHATEASAALGGLQDERDWASAKAAKTIEALDFYVRTYSPPKRGAHVVEARQIIADLREESEWQSAFSTQDQQKLTACVSKYPTSKHVERAREVLWAIRWPAFRVDKANSVTIYSEGRGIIRGELLISLSGAFGGPEKPPEPAGPNRVVIWRNFTPQESAVADTLGLRPGMAFLRTDSGELKFIRKLDLNKTDDEICAEFGITR